jgi:hypothetical protein
MAAINVPEIDALLARWAADIKAIVERIPDTDMEARMRLESLRHDLDGMDDTVRIRAVHFEEKLERLKARMLTPAEPLALDVVERDQVLQANEREWG